MKRIICMIFILAIVLLFSACGGSREAISAAEFTSRMTEAGHTVEDITHILEDENSPVTDILVADCGAFVVEFLVYETMEYARRAFELIRREIEGMRGNTSSYSSVNTSNFSRYRLTSGGQLGVVSRIGSTIVVVITSADNRADVDAVLELLGY